MKTQCPHCKARFNVNDAAVGRQAKCPKCAKPFIIAPVIETPPSAPAPAKSPEPVQTPPQEPEPPKAVKTAELTAPPLETPQPPPPQKAPEPTTPTAKAPKPVAAAAKAPEPQASPQKPAQPAAPTVQKTPPTRMPEPMEETPAPKAPPKKTLSKAVYVYGWLAVRILTGILAGLGLKFALSKAADSTVLATFAAADVFLLCSVAIELLLFYKMWDAIQNAQSSFSPGKAVAFLFIPLYNIYWALLMTTGFAEECNALLRRSPAKAKELPATLYAVYAFMFLLSTIFITAPLICTLIISNFVNRVFSNLGDLSWPLAFFVAAIGLAHLVTYVLFAMKTCTAINTLRRE